MATVDTKMSTDLAALGDNLGDEGVKPRAKGRSEAQGETRVRIILEENETIPPNGQFFGVNGKGYFLRPGEEADVPESVIEVLNNAVMSTPIMDNQQSIIGYRDKLRFPYRIIRKGGARA
jgi:hypothetical protein